ncbi:transposase [Solemya velum gill symbiont]|uniref:transposase n=1 Tax=Solemya velum gill symbiont TaxID=2340 RepID=UPI0015C3B1BA|nr:transposase [Solemya velum gill symbiont]
MDTIAYIGVDVGKAELVVYSEQLTMLNRTYKNCDDDIRQMLETAQNYSIRIMVICEGTGGYEEKLRLLCYFYKIPCQVVNGARMRQFASSCGQMAKTDKLDSKIIHEYGKVFQLYENYRELSLNPDLEHLYQRYQQLVKLRAMEKNHYENLHDSIIQNSILEHIDDLSQQIKQCLVAIKGVIASDSVLQHNYDYLCSIHGVGEISAIAVLSDLPEIGQLSNKKISAMVGLAPYEKESGQKTNGKHIRGGRFLLRKVLYMAALASIRLDDEMKTFYHRLRAKGKPFKVAIVACMRKLVIAMNTVVKEQRLWLNQT